VAMTYIASNELMNDMTFRGRVKVACLKYADSIMIEASTVPAHNTRERWALSTMQQPDMIASQIHPPTVMDPAVQEAGADILDSALQAAVEGTVNKIL
jgi:hypothetical protein